MAHMAGSSASKLEDECISKPVWDHIHTERFENASLEKVEALLDESFVPEGWLDPPKKKIKLSLKSKSRFASPTDKEKFSEGAKGVVPENTKKITHGQRKPFLRGLKRETKLFLRIQCLLIFCLAIIPCCVQISVLFCSSSSK